MALLEEIKLKLIDAILMGRDVVYMRNVESSSMWIFSHGFGQFGMSVPYSETPRLAVRWFPPLKEPHNYSKVVTLKEAYEILESEKEWIDKGWSGSFTI